MPEPDFKDPVVLDPLLTLGSQEKFPEQGVPTLEEQRAKHTASEQVGFGENVGLGFERDAAAAAATRVIQDELPGLEEDLELGPDSGISADTEFLISAGLGAMSLMGMRQKGPEWDKRAEVDALLDGIEFIYHETIMDAPTVQAAWRERKRILNSLSIKQKAAIQREGGAAQFMGGFLDVDLALMVGSGGSMALTKLGSGISKGIKSQRTAGAIKGAVAGAEEGIIAGTLVAGGRKAWDETVTWQDASMQIAMSMAAGTALGSGLGAAAPRLANFETSMQNLQDDLSARIAADDPTLYNVVDPDGTWQQTSVIGPEALSLDVLDPDLAKAVDTAGALADSVGAARVPGVFVNRRARVELEDPAGPISPESRVWMETADDWAHDTDFLDRRTADNDTFFGKVSNTLPQAIFGNSFFQRAYQSQSTVMNWMSGSLFESAHGMGRGKATAAVMMGNYHRRIAGHVMDVPQLMDDWATTNNKGIGGTADGISDAGVKEFNRAVMIERNAREYSLQRTKDPHIKAAADAYDNWTVEGWSIARGRTDEISMDGFQHIDKNPHHQTYGWSGKTIRNLIADNVTDIKKISTALANSYRKTGIQNKDADAIANAVVKRALANDADIETSVYSLLNRDGQEWLNQALGETGISVVEREAIIRRLVGDRKEGAKEAYAKRRNSLDLADTIETKNGSNLQVVDLLSQDLIGDTQRRTRSISGAAALARQGVTNRAQRSELISAIHSQQRALGEEITPANEISAMLSHFDGGGVKGWSSMGASDPAVQGRGYAMAKRLTNWAYLGKLGLTQAGETGQDIAQQGIANWWHRGPSTWWNKQARENRDALLQDMAVMTGELGVDHKLFAEHLMLDDFSMAEQGWFMDGLDKLSAKGSQYQAYLSGFNHVRGFQQKTAAAGITDKVFRVLKDDLDGVGEGLSEGLIKRFQSDLGLDLADLNRLQNLIENGTIEFGELGGKSFVNRINPDKWDVDLQDVFGSAVARNMDQIVQRSIAGEQDAWMATGMGGLLTHLKTFPMAAFNKQFVRNFRMMDKQAVASVGYGMATATIAAAARELSKGERAELDIEELARSGFEYSNMTGWVPFYYDPLMVMMGLEEHAINPYAGRHGSSEITPTVFDWSEKLLKAPGALKAAADGEADWQDRQAIKALPFANLLVWSNIIDQIGRKPKE